MSTEDEVRRLRGEGYTIRQIADALGLSKSMVGRIVKPEDDADLALGADELDDIALLGSSSDERELVPPITFVGVVRGVDGSGDDWRYMDAYGSVSALDLYRHRQMLEREGRDDELAAIDAALDEQMDADPTLVKVSDFLGRIKLVPVWEVAEAGSRYY